MKAPKQPSLETRSELAEMMANDTDEITLSTGRKLKIGWIKPFVQDKIDCIITAYEKAKKKLGVKDDNVPEDVMNKANKITRQFCAQAVAAILLNKHYFLLKLFWTIKWRWMYYFGKEDMSDYLLIITQAKKKAQPQESYWAMVSLMDMTTMWTTMSKKEAEAYRQELELVREHQSLKSSQA